MRWMPIAFWMACYGEGERSDASVPPTDASVDREDDRDAGPWPWREIAGAGAPRARFGHAAVWTGSEMIVWGGHAGTGPDNTCQLDDGARYDPARDSWTPVTEEAAPGPSAGSAAFWTGTEMVLWGGFNSADAIKKDCAQPPATPGRYDPALDRWSPMSENLELGRRGNYAWAWTGEEFLVWGGWDVSGMLGDGARWDRATDAWRPLSNVGAPSPRRHAAFDWTGAELLVWGGWECQDGLVCALHDGARYDPASDTWRPIGLEGAPEVSVSSGHSVWTGSRWLVWGWGDGEAPGFEGGAYDPTEDAWSEISSDGAPPPAEGGTVVWTGEEAIQWGGYQGVAVRYSPELDRWRSVEAEVPGGAAGERDGHSAVWTGEEMIVWGGDSAGELVATGFAYRPPR